MSLTAHINGYFERRSRLFLVSANLVILSIIGVIDYLTGYEIALSLFYAIPIYFTSWFGGKVPGLAFAALSAAIIATSDLLAGQVYARLPIEAWNLAMHLGFFIIVALLVARLRSDFDEHKGLIVELASALSEVKKLSGLLPICASCKRIRDDRGYWSQIETYISSHSDAQFSHGICPACMRKLYPDIADRILPKEE